MLEEGRRRLERGTDVVIAYVETMVGPGPPPPPPAWSWCPGTPGGAHRWQDVETLLAAGIDVVTSVDVQHLESLNDVVESITGTRQVETVPDQVVRGADTVELVDMSPQSLQRRMTHGNIYAADKIDHAPTHYFRESNLAALRELALLWLADRVDEGLDRYRAAHGIASTWAARERVVVAVSDRVHVDLPQLHTVVLADTGLLDRVIANLVENALRHTPPGTPIEITAHPAEEDTGRVQLEVIDHGPGIPPGSRDALFAPFQRLGDVPDGDGLGLGLAVARGLTEIIHGRLSAYDTPGGGLTMVVDLPAARASAQTTAAPAERTR